MLLTKVVLLFGYKSASIGTTWWRIEARSSQSKYFVQGLPIFLYSPNDTSLHRPDLVLNYGRGSPSPIFFAIPVASKRTSLRWSTQSVHDIHAILGCTYLGIGVTVYVLGENEITLSNSGTHSTWHNTLSNRNIIHSMPTNFGAPFLRTTALWGIPAL